MISDKITLQELTNALSEKQGLNKKDSELLIKGMFDLIEEALAKEKYVKIKGLGTFKLIEVDSRESINVNTGERIEIQGHTKVSFTPETSLKELINKPFAHFETVILNEGTVLDDDNDVNEDNKAEIIKQEVEITAIPTETDNKENSINTEEVKSADSIIEEQVIEVADTNDITSRVESTIDETSNDKPCEVSDKPSVEEIESKHEEKTSKSLIIVTVLLILIIIAGAYWLFRPTDDSSPVYINETTIEETKSTTEIIEDDGIKTDTIHLLNEEKETTEENKIEFVKQEKVASLADTTEYNIVGTKATHTLKNGETIIKVALKYYGAKNFWPYIAKHNEKIIKDANNVPVGTQLQIPELSPKN